MCQLYLWVRIGLSKVQVTYLATVDISPNFKATRTDKAKAYIFIFCQTLNKKWINTLFNKLQWLFGGHLILKGIFSRSGSEYCSSNKILINADIQNCKFDIFENFVYLHLIWSRHALPECKGAPWASPYCRLVALKKYRLCVFLLCCQWDYNSVVL